MAGWVEASVSVLRCDSAGHLTPHLTFRGDTDMVTMGLTSLSSFAENEIVVAELLPDEFSDQTGRFVQDRINKFLSRDDLRFLPLVRVEQHTPPPGLPFVEFSKAYRAPSLVFSCPKCGGNAVPVRSETPTQFQRGGGKLTVLAEIDLRG